MKKIFTIFILFSSLLFAQDENSDCFRCHSMQTLSMIDDDSGVIKSFALSPENFAKSNHADFSCIDCHSEEYATFPHAEELKEEAPYCLDCHENDEDPQLIQFDSIEEAFEESVHKKVLEDKFTCYSCHDPHSFKLIARNTENITNTILYDNQVCMDCHFSSEKFDVLTDKTRPNLDSTHAWLPHQKLHWQNVRCIDCHTDPEQPGVSHLIVEKEKAVKNCVACHSAESQLTQTLYKFQSKVERDEEGFLNAIILNNSYVVGATRNYYLNLISFVVFGLTLLALSIHGLRHAGAKRRVPKAPESEKEYFYPLWLRGWHWVNAILFMFLIVTGLTMQYVNTDDPFISFSTAITVHNASGVLLTLNYILFFLGNIVTGNYKQYIPKLKGMIKRMILQGKFYLIGIFRNEPHPFETTKENKFNPLQQLTYLKIMYLAFPIIMITGWGLLFPEILIEEFLGNTGLFLTAMLHTATGFFLSLFMFGHIYLATTGKTFTSNFKAMVTGWHEMHDDHHHENDKK